MDEETPKDVIDLIGIGVLRTDLGVHLMENPDGSYTLRIGTFEVNHTTRTVMTKYVKLEVGAIGS